ncbi:putative oxidoreductase [Rosa chinensis]|uniref:Putative oxidoreductase n=1 Tax=Rosa chinensis TaxID=74649 RepID=A0A2P6PIF1_ROSCH|nr:putative oxidoreductase [Rosa chinensis]
MVRETFKLGAKELKEMMAAVYSESRDGLLKEKHVADAVVFLASQDSAFVTGHNFVVDGGFGTKSLSVLKP